jgi:transcriptional regulator with XRE-family HTH domain
MNVDARRYRSLVLQMRDEYGGRHGWKTQVAKRLGVTQPFITFIASGEREAGIDSIALARDRLGLRPEFFSDASLGDSPNYKDFVGRDPGDRPEVLRVVLDWRLHTEVGQTATAEEIAWAEGLSFRQPGGAALTPDIISSYLRSIRAERAGKVAAPSPISPDVPPNLRRISSSKAKR